jgi:hypothetical protein
MIFVLRFSFLLLFGGVSSRQPNLPPASRTWFGLGFFGFGQS